MYELYQILRLLACVKVTPSLHHDKYMYQLERGRHTVTNFLSFKERTKQKNVILPSSTLHHLSCTDYFPMIQTHDEASSKEGSDWLIYQTLPVLLVNVWPTPTVYIFCFKNLDKKHIRNYSFYLVCSVFLIYSLHYY